MMLMPWSPERWEALDPVNGSGVACLFFTPGYLGFATCDASAGRCWVEAARVTFAPLIMIFPETRSDNSPAAREYVNPAVVVWAVMALWLVVLPALPGPRSDRLGVGLVVGVVTIVYLWLPKNAWRVHAESGHRLCCLASKKVVDHAYPCRAMAFGTYQPEPPLRTNPQTLLSTSNGPYGLHS